MVSPGLFVMESTYRGEDKVKKKSSGRKIILNGHTGLLPCLSSDHTAGPINTHALCRHTSITQATGQADQKAATEQAFGLCEKRNVS